jgi:hypothetical protein
LGIRQGGVRSRMTQQVLGFAILFGPFTTPPGRSCRRTHSFAARSGQLLPTRVADHRHVRNPHVAVLSAVFVYAAVFGRVFLINVPVTAFVPPRARRMCRVSVRATHLFRPATKAVLELCCTSWTA